MQNVPLADLAVGPKRPRSQPCAWPAPYDESSAGRRAAQDFQEAGGNAVLKYWVCKRADARRNALEGFEGNGFKVESGMPRLYREAPLNSIWEGSGNVQCLDVHAR